MTGAVPIREAATVILLRDGDEGLETWLMRRVPKMAFAPGMTVFPGGGVDPVDSAGEPAAEAGAVAAQLGLAVEHAATLLRTAVREIAEETGVLLTPAAMRPWARWITPEGESRRYDTYFFVAALPPDALAAAISTEASIAEWVRLEEALTQYQRGERPMLPPTVHNLTEVAGHRSAADVLAAATSRTIEPIMPVLRPATDGQGWVADLGNGTELPLPASFISATGRTLR